METTFTPARIKLIHVAHERNFIEHLIENEQRSISMVNVIEKFTPNFFAADKDYLEKVRNDAIHNIDKLADELKIVELKFKAAHDAMTDADWEEIPL